MAETEKVADTAEKQTAHGAQKQSVIRRFGHWCAHRKRYSIPLGLLILLLVLLVIPTSRYALAGPFWRESVVVVVTDDETGAPVSQATVKTGDHEALTDKTGKAVLADIPAGFHQLAIEKPNYKDGILKVEAPLFAQETKTAVKLKATGRTVTFTVVNRITGKPIANALVNAGNNNAAKSGEDGTATIVVPVGPPTVEVTITNDGYNQTKTKLNVGKTNTVRLTPEGQVYFLSKRTGKIDVVRTNLDGTGRKTIVKGTGAEDDNRTSLLAARDWRYLVLHAKREQNEAVYLIDTKTGKLETIDQAANDKTNFELVGWSGHRFIYTVTRDRNVWEAGARALKSYDAKARQLKVIDETEKGTKESYRYAGDETSQHIHSFYILKDDQVVYLKVWSGPEWRLKNKQSVIASVQADGLSKRVLKGYKSSVVGNIEAKLYTPQNIHYRVLSKNYERLENVQTVNGAITPVPASQQKFDQGYPTFLISPNGKRSFWAESRDGKNTLFIGDNNATGGTIKQLASLSDYGAYGWFTDDYLLLQKNSSELYITTPERLKEGAAGQPLKISDYHKPNINFAGYGYGYGGL